jgi:glycosyltransferase involved in cell wall biosynthesis
MSDSRNAPSRVAVVVRRLPSRHTEEPDGFAFRHWYIIENLTRTCDVLLVRAPETGSPTTSLPPSGVTIREVNYPRPPKGGHWVGRAWRAQAVARSLARSQAGQRWEQELVATVRDWGADLVVALTNYSISDAVRVAHDFPTIVFAEEDLSIHSPDTTQTVRARALVAAERWTDNRYLRRLDAEVVVISRKEEQWAARAFPNSRIHVVPHFIDLEYWQSPVPSGSAVQSDIFVVGAMQQTRNAEGLTSILGELVKQLPEASLPIVSVASRAEPHPSLADCGYPRLQLLGPVDDVRPHYAGATVTLVPSFIVSGSKTTILQGWATGTAVVTTDAAAESIGAVDGQDVLAARSPAGVAAQLIRLLASSDMRLSLAEKARASVSDLHSPSAAMSRVNALVADGTHARQRTR